MKIKYLSLFFGLSLLFVSCGNNPKGDISNEENSIEKENEKDSYTVTWKNYDGNILEIDSEVLKDTFPSYDGDIPVRKSTEDYTYTFKGWEPEVKAVTSDITYTATFDSFELPKTAKYTIMFDLNGGSSYYYSHTNREFKVSKLDKNDFFFDVKKENHRFAGWMCNGIQVFDSDGNIINNIELRENLTFVAMFEEQVFLDITTNLYNPNNKNIVSSFKELDSSIGKVTASKYYDWNTQINLSIELMPGYTFIGWYSENTLLSSLELYNFVMWDKDMTLEARIQYSYFTLNIKASNRNYGQVLLKNNTSYKDNYSEKKFFTEEITVSALSKTDIRFLGWFDEMNNLVSTNALYTFKMINQNYELSAKWDKFSVNYSLNGGVNNPNNIVSYSNDTPDFNLLEPTREGYSFVGWKLDGEFVDKIKNNWNKDIVLTAVWEYFTLTTNSNDPSCKGYTKYTDAKITPGKDVTIEATIDNFLYSFTGWYDGDILLSTNQTYCFKMPKKSVTYTASYLLTEEAYSNFITRTGSDGISIAGIKDKNVDNIVVPPNTIHIDSYAFAKCKRIKKMVLPVSAMKYSGFENLFDSDTIFDDFELVINGGTGTKIKRDIFNGFKYIKKLFICDSIEFIDSSSFYGSSKVIEEIRLPWFASIRKILNDDSNFKPSVKKITIGEEAGSQIDGFTDCSSLEIVNLPNNKATSLAREAFKGCSSLTSITIPNGVTSIGVNAFYKCTSLTSITIPNSVTSIDDGAFWRCSSLTTLTIPNGVTYIGASAFADCTSLTSISIPDSITVINVYAFFNCISLTSLTIPNSVTSIGKGIVQGCTSIETITLPFIGGNLTFSDNIQNRFVSVFDYIFGDGEYGSDGYAISPKSLKEVTITGGNIMNEAFLNCRYLTSITIPNGISSIGEDAFYNCTSLTSITIPNSVTSIGRRAFYKCTSLTSITIPNSVTFIDDLAFGNCDSLNTIHFDDTIAKFKGEFVLKDYKTKNDSTVYCTDGIIQVNKGETWGQGIEIMY